LNIRDRVNTTSVIGMSRPEPAPVAQDSRGIIDPGAFQERMTLNRYPAGPELEGLIDRFWAVAWSLPAGVVHSQAVLTHPGANFSVSPAEPDGDLRPGPVEAMLNGVELALSTRRLSGSGVAVAAMTTPGGLGAFLPGPVSELNNRVLPLGPALGFDGNALIADVIAAIDQPAKVAVLAGRLRDVVATADPERVRTARDVAAIARLAETDRSLRRLDDLAAAAGVGVRTLQRLFAEYAGVSPT
jgi:hypothetical protein